MTDQPQDIRIEADRMRRKGEAADARWAGVLTALVGTIAILILAILCDTTKERELVVITLVLSGFGLFWLPIGLLSGWVAHKCFTGTDFPPSRVAVILALIVVLSILGWGFVATLSG
jgi:cobalamin biosynthesis protein CobD/CbiB